MDIHTQNDWECSICLSSDYQAIGINCRSQIKKCGHIFHLGCIQKHYIIKNQIWNDPEECVLECPLCRSKTIKNNFGVNVRFDKASNQMIFKKDNKQLCFKINLYGNDLFKRDIQIARNMLQNIANICFDVDSYWLVAQNITIDKLNLQYSDDEKNCAKLICLPTQQDEDVYIERSFGI